MDKTMPSRQLLLLAFSISLVAGMASAAAPDINITHIDGYVDNNSGYNFPEYFSYFNDGNLSIKFLAQDADLDDLNFNMWYSGSAGARENVIVADLNLSDAFCDSNDFTSPRYCTYDWNANPWITPDGNYFIDVVVNDGTSTDSNSSSTFKVSPCPRTGWSIDRNVTMYGYDCNIIAPKNSGAINIDMNWITLDCNGLDINGNDRNYGVYVSGQHGFFTIKNCTIRNYWYNLHTNIASSDGNIFSNTIISPGRTGIYLNSASHRTVISDNNVHYLPEDPMGLYHGIYPSGANDVKILRNTVTSSKTNTAALMMGAITLYSSTRALVMDNNIDISAGAGIFLYYNVSDSNITGNNVANFEATYGRAINLRSINTGNRIWNNTLSDSYHAVYAKDRSNGNIVYGNTITGARGGAVFVSYDCNENQFYNNYFANNTVQVQDLNLHNDYNTTKDCNTPNIIGGQCTGGNYWDTYPGYDSDEDGIGSSTFPVADGNGVDYLPLSDSLNTASGGTTGSTTSYNSDAENGDEGEDGGGDAETVAAAGGATIASQPTAQDITGALGPVLSEAELETAIDASSLVGISTTIVPLNTGTTVLVRVENVQDYHLGTVLVAAPVPKEAGITLADITSGFPFTVLETPAGIVLVFSVEGIGAGESIEISYNVGRELPGNYTGYWPQTMLLSAQKKVAQRCSADAECGDGNPCTRDICGIAGMCRSYSLADRTSCGSGMRCEAGVCRAMQAAQEQPVAAAGMPIVVVLAALFAIGVAFMYFRKWRGA